MFNAKVNNEVLTIYTYEELPKTVQETVRRQWVSEWLDDKLYEFQENDSFGNNDIPKDTADVFDENDCSDWEIKHLDFGFTNDKVDWFTVSFGTDDILGILDPEDRRRLRHDYGLDYNFRDNHVTVDYPKGSQIPMYHLDKFRAEINDREKFIQEYLDLLHEKKPELLSKLNNLFKNYFNETVIKDFDLLDYYEEENINSIEDAIKLNNGYLFLASGKKIMISDGRFYLFDGPQGHMINLEKA